MCLRGSGVLNGFFLFPVSVCVKAIANLPARVGVTAKLSVDYRAPTKADQVRVFYIVYVSDAI